MSLIQQNEMFLLSSKTLKWEHWKRVVRYLKCYQMFNSSVEKQLNYPCHDNSSVITMFKYYIRFSNARFFIFPFLEKKLFSYTICPDYNFPPSTTPRSSTPHLPLVPLPFCLSFENYRFLSFNNQTRQPKR